MVQILLRSLVQFPVKTEALQMHSIFLLLLKAEWDRKLLALLQKEGACVRDIVDKAHDEATKILTEHKAEVILVAETLLEKETITAEEIDSLIKTGKLPAKVKAEVGASENLSEEEKAVIEKPVVKAKKEAEKKPEAKEKKPAEKPEIPDKTEAKPKPTAKKKASPKAKKDE